MGRIASAVDVVRRRLLLGPATAGQRNGGYRRGRVLAVPRADVVAGWVAGHRWLLLHRRDLREPRRRRRVRSVQPRPVGGDGRQRGEGRVPAGRWAVAAGRRRGRVQRYVRGRGAGGRRGRPAAVAGANRAGRHARHPLLRAGCQLLRVSRVGSFLRTLSVRRGRVWAAAGGVLLPRAAARARVGQNHPPHPAPALRVRPSDLEQNHGNLSVILQLA